ncbi:MAG TPA: polysaccharide biosynthesis tyrosine autokinase, partial [Jatrophihabitantaceae bacterium]|nr:polysaccharide biosynthesis tyrosine autokinase [Jatrophihabitantaceae bacterium]
MTLRAYLRVMRERWKLVAFFVVLSIGLAIVITALTPKEYEATAQVYVASSTTGDPLSVSEASLYLQSQVTTFAAIVTAPDVLSGIRTELNLSPSITDSDLKAKLTADAPAAQTLINIHATDKSADEAAAIANAASSAFVKAVEHYTTPPGSTAPSVQLFPTDPATAPSSPVSPVPVLNIAVGLFLGLLIGVSLAVVRDVLDNRIKDIEVLSKVTGLPAMGIVAEDKKTERHVIATRAGTRNTRAENFRQLRANLQFASVDNHPRVIAVTSSIPGEGKTTIAINLASTLAEAGFSVCLVDADLRRPSIADALGLISPVGLTSVLIHQISLSEALQNAGANLYVLTSGPIPPNPSEVLASSYVRDVIRTLTEKVDFVVIDTAPLLPVADGTEIAALADGTLLVARFSVTTEIQVKRAAQ